MFFQEADKSLPIQFGLLICHRRIFLGFYDEDSRNYNGERRYASMNEEGGFQAIMIADITANRRAAKLPMRLMPPNEAKARPLMVTGTTSVM